MSYTWLLHYASFVVSQMDLERDVFDRLNNVQSDISQKAVDDSKASLEDEVGMVNELAQVSTWLNNFFVKSSLTLSQQISN